MSKKAFLMIGLGAFGGVLVVLAQINVSQLDFIAPSISDRGGAASTAGAGLIVFDTTDRKFYGRTDTASPAWVPLSGDSGGTGVSPIPVGTILPFGGTTAPTGYLLCNGESKLVSDFPPLFAVIGNAFGGDSAHFNLPDFRGRFLRGWANGSENDPDRSKRAYSAIGGNTGDRIGTLQGDAFKEHTHSYTPPLLRAAASGGLNYAQVDPTAVETAKTGGYETRPKNVYVNYIIKY